MNEEFEEKIQKLSKNFDTNIRKKIKSKVSLLKQKKVTVFNNDSSIGAIMYLGCYEVGFYSITKICNILMLNGYIPKKDETERFINYYRKKMRG